MAIPQTDFVNGSFLSYPIGNYVKLFSVLGTRTKRTFFEAIQKLDGKDGEGMSPDQMIGLFQVGLIPYKPGITFDETSELVQEYINSNGDSGLHDKLNANLQKISDELNKSVTGEETANPSDEGGETEEEDDPLEGPATTC
jgi:hypothetical protein